MLGLLANLLFWSTCAYVDYSDTSVYFDDDDLFDSTEYYEDSCYLKEDMYYEDMYRSFKKAEKVREFSRKKRDYERRNLEDRKLVNKLRATLRKVQREKQERHMRPQPQNMISNMMSEMSDPTTFTYGCALTEKFDISGYLGWRVSSTNLLYIGVSCNIVASTKKDKEDSEIGFFCLARKVATIGDILSLEIAGIVSVSFNAISVAINNNEIPEPFQEKMDIQDKDQDLKFALRKGSIDDIAILERELNDLISDKFAREMSVMKKSTVSLGCSARLIFSNAIVPLSIEVYQDTMRKYTIEGTGSDPEMRTICRLGLSF